jgi:glucose-6-phosphate isomerase
MKPIRFDWKHSRIVPKDVKKIGRRLLPEINAMKEALTKDYEDDRASINLCSDQLGLYRVMRLIREKKKVRPRYVVVVGIGGSNLGTMAIQEAVLGQLHNQTSEGTKVLYADTVDPDSIQSIISIIKPLLKKRKKIIINGISKSGGTTETIANFEILVNLLKKHRKDFHKHVVVTTGQDSNYWNLSLKKAFSVLSIPEKVGGRYSVFSPVGLFPLGLVGVNIKELLKGACLMRKKCLNENVLQNPAALSAILIYLHHKKGKHIQDLFLFSKDLESIGKWYRQLIGESIGKEKNRKGKIVHEGITPTVSIGSTDLHSMAQLDLGGPYDKFSTIVSLNHEKKDLKVPEIPAYDHLVKHIQGKHLHGIMNAILQGVKIAYVKDRRPFTEVILPDKTAGSIGQFLQMKMMEMMYLGFLLKVNPFDQPNVENYKLETKKILARG